MKKTWIIIAAIVVLIGGAVVYVLVSGTDDTSTFRQDYSQDAANGQQDERPSDDSDELAPGGRYTDYSAEAVAEADGRKWLFFHAPWCPQCRELEADIFNRGVPEGLTIFKVDFDTSTELKQRYGVTLQTTVVEIDDEGNEVGKFTAYNDPSLGAVLDALGE
jgi:thiol-disulfide isomerase/thioredoxin